MNKNLKKYLGVDWGEARIGLALADGETKLATPFKTVGSVAEVLELVQTEAIDVLVLGRPDSITDTKFPVSKQFEAFLNELKSKTSVKIETIDERLSSKAADALPGSKKTKAGRDEIAAMLILQAYLDKLSQWKKLII